MAAMGVLLAVVIAVAGAAILHPCRPAPVPADKPIPVAAPAMPAGVGDLAPSKAVMP